MSNEFLPTAYDEVVHRLALGIEPGDAARALQPARAVEVVLDGTPTAEANAPGDLYGLDRATTGLTPVARRRSGRFVLLYRTRPGGAPATDDATVVEPAATVELRLHDCRRHYVSRRISYPIPTTARTRAPRVRRPLLFPGAAYDLSETATTGLRGRVIWPGDPDAEVPVRWARVEARVDGVLVGRAHGDDRGEFLLLLEPGAGGVGDLRTPLTASVTVFGPPALPAPPDEVTARRDPLWDLPLEELATLDEEDDISTGARIPDSYTPSGARLVTFVPGRLISEEPKFVLTP